MPAGGGRPGAPLAEGGSPHQSLQALRRPAQEALHRPGARQQPAGHVLRRAHQVGFKYTHHSSIKTYNLEYELVS